MMILNLHQKMRKEITSPQLPPQLQLRALQLLQPLLLAQALLVKSLPNLLKSSHWMEMMVLGMQTLQLYLLEVFRFGARCVKNVDVWEPMAAQVARAAAASDRYPDAHDFVHFTSTAQRDVAVTLRM